MACTVLEDACNVWDPCRLGLIDVAVQICGDLGGMNRHLVVCSFAWPGAWVDVSVACVVVL